MEAMPSDESSSAAVRRGQFATTRWSMVLAAGRKNSPESQSALAALCEAYWYPLYAFLRRKGYAAGDAQDLTQGFFALLLERNDVAMVRKERGKFRSYLIAALQNYLANERDRQRAQKRGGGRKPLSLDFASAENRYAAQAADRRTPEDAFARQWALTLLEQVQSALHQEMSSQGKAEQWERLHVYLTGETAAASYVEAAAALDMSEGAVKTAVHRLRRRFGELLRREIAETISDESAIDEEIQELFAALRR
jgi:RNA polymerase sigma-70 factor (ECF subfamily)